MVHTSRPYRLHYSRNTNICPRQGLPYLLVSEYYSITSLRCKRMETPTALIGTHFNDSGYLTRSEIQQLLALPLTDTSFYGKPHIQKVAQLPAEVDSDMRMVPTRISTATVSWHFQLYVDQLEQPAYAISNNSRKKGHGGDFYFPSVLLFRRREGEARN